jgi:hypothetical protein
MELGYYRCVAIFMGNKQDMAAFHHGTQYHKLPIIWLVWGLECAGNINRVSIFTLSQSISILYFYIK